MRRIRRVRSAQGFNSFLLQALQDHRKVYRRAEALKTRLLQLNSLLQGFVDSSLRRGLQVQQRREECVMRGTELQAERLNLKLEWQQSSSKARQLKQQQEHIKQDLTVVSQKSKKFTEKVLLLHDFSASLEDRLQHLSLQRPLKAQELETLEQALLESQNRIRQLKAEKRELSERYEQVKIVVKQITQKKRHVTKQTHFSVQQRQNFYRLASQHNERLRQLESAIELKEGQIRSLQQENRRQETKGASLRRRLSKLRERCDRLKKKAV